MKNRLIALFGVVIMSISIVVLEQPKQASAWTGHLPTCSSLMTNTTTYPYGAFPTDWNQEFADLKSKWSSGTGYVVWGYNSGGTVIPVVSMDYLGTAKIKFQTVSGVNSFQYTTTVKEYSVQSPYGTTPSTQKGWIAGYKDGSARDASTGNDWNSSSPYDTAARTVSNAVCVEGTNGTTTVTGFTGGTIPGGFSYTPPALADNTYENCSAIDVPCHLRNVGKFIVLGITAIFVPSPDFFSDKFEELNTFFTAKFGVLTFPFEFFGTFFNLLDAYSSDATVHAGSLFGQPVELDFASGSLGTSLTTFIFMCIRFVTALALVYALIKKYKKVVHK